MGDSVLIENQNIIEPARVEYISIQANEGIIHFLKLFWGHG